MVESVMLMLGTLRIPLLAATAIVCAVAVLLATSGSAGADGDGASPTRTPKVEPLSSEITIRFVRDGELITISLAQPFSRIEADGVLCNLGVTNLVVVVDHFSLKWPLGNPTFPEECLKDPPTVVRFEFPTGLPEPLAADVVWLGEDVVFDLEVPENIPDLSETPTPSQPNDLPSAGGGARPRSEGPVIALVGILVVAGACVAIYASSGWVKTQ